MYDRIMRQARLRRDRQQTAVIDTSKYLDTLREKMPEAVKTIGVIEQKLSRQRAALKVTDDEILNLKKLMGDPQQIAIEDEIAENEKAAAAKIGRRR